MSLQIHLGFLELLYRFLKNYIKQLHFLKVVLLRTHHFLFYDILLLFKLLPLLTSIRPVGRKQGITVYYSTSLPNSIQSGRVGRLKSALVEGVTPEITKWYAAGFFPLENQLLMPLGIYRWDWGKMMLLIPTLASPQGSFFLTQNNEPRMQM